MDVAVGQFSKQGACVYILRIIFGMPAKGISQKKINFFKSSFIYEFPLACIQKSTQNTYMYYPISRLTRRHSREKVTRFY